MTKRVYLAGPRDPDDPWHDRAIDAAEHLDVECINPFELNDYESNDEIRDNALEIHAQDMRAVRQSDAMLLRRIDDYNLCGASMEAQVAYECGVPVYVWNDASSEIPIMLDAVADVIVDSLADAVVRVGI